MLKWAPMAMLLSLFWILGNNQMFGNELKALERIHDIVDPMHPIITMGSGIKADTMILVLIPLYVLFKVGYKLLAAAKKKAKWNEDYNLDEDLAPYFNSLSGSEQKVMYANEVYYRNAHEIKTISDEALEKLRTCKNKGSKYCISTTPSYYIFDNMFFQDSLQFMPMNYRDEDIDYQSSDPIAQAIFQGDNTRMVKGKNSKRKEDFTIIQSDFSDAAAQAKKKTLAKLLKKKKTNPELK